MVCSVSRSHILRSVFLNKSLWDVRQAKYISRMHINFNYRRKMNKNINPSNYCDISQRVFEPCFVNNGPVTKRLICRSISDSGNETESDSEGMEDFLEVSSPEGKESVHDILSPNTEDPVVLRLISASSIEEVFDVIKENEANVKARHLAHSVLALWDLQLSSLLLSEKPYISVPSHLVSEKFISRLLSSDYTKRFLELLKENGDSMNTDELACSLLYLGKMGFTDVNASEGSNMQLLNSVVGDLYKCCQNKLQTFSLPSMSRFMAGTRFWRHANPSVFDFSSCRNLVEDRVLRSLDSCSSAVDFRLITICLAHLRPPLGLDVLHKYKKITSDLISKEIFDVTELRPVLRAAAFLNLPHWSHLNVDLIRTLLLLLEDKVKELKPSDVLLVNYLLQSQMEPSILIREVQEEASTLLQGKTHDVSQIELMCCLTQSVQPSNKKRFEDAVMDFVCSSLSPRLLPVTFNVLRNLKTSNVNLCDAFWSRTLDYIIAKPSLQNGFRLLRYCHWYMHFNNNLAGTYHHHGFETCISEMLLHNMPEWSSPSWIARAGAFIIAYCRRGPQVEAVIDVSKKLIELVPDFNANDCFIVSHGMHIAMGARSSQKRNKNVVWLWSQLARKLDHWSEVLLKRPDIPLRDVNMVMKGFIERRPFNQKGSVIQEYVANYYDSALKEQQTAAMNEGVSGLSSRMIRDHCAIMIGCGWSFPAAVEWICEYVIQNGRHMTGETIDKVVQLLFLFNHWPENGPQFFEAVSQVLDRDKERIPGLSLIQVSLGLCFLNALPITLLHHIFTVDFLEKIDDEIKYCYAKAIYPMRVRHNLMELNRAVCLGYPEADVPWFHSNYCKGIISMEPETRSHVHTSVHSTLTELVGGREDMIQERAYTPYFHKIDFLLVLDEFSRPIKPQMITQKDVLERRLTRVAVVIRGGDNYCRKTGKMRPHLRGLPRLHERHLQLLGYEVVGIPVHFWDSLQMGSHEARVKHMKEKIFGCS